MVKLFLCQSLLNRVPGNLNEKLFLQKISPVMPQFIQWLGKIRGETYFSWFRVTLSRDVKHFALYVFVYLLSSVFYSVRYLLHNTGKTGFCHPGFLKITHFSKKKHKSA